MVERYSDTGYTVILYEKLSWRLWKIFISFYSLNNSRILELTKLMYIMWMEFSLSVQTISYEFERLLVLCKKIRIKFYIYQKHTYHQESYGFTWSEYGILLHYYDGVIFSEPWQDCSRHFKAPMLHRILLGKC